MLDDLGETIQEATCAVCHTSQAHLAGGSSGALFPSPLILQLGLRDATLPAGHCKGRTDLFQTGSNGKSAWVWTGSGFRHGCVLGVCEVGVSKPHRMSSPVKGEV